MVIGDGYDTLEKCHELHCLDPASEVFEHLKKNLVWSARNFLRHVL